MKTLIAYATKHGSAEKCANILSNKLNTESELYNLKKVKDIDLSQYDKVIIGGSIYAGTMRKEASEFCLTNLDALKEKKVGLFICCMRDGSDAETQLNDSFPEELKSIAAARECFGGEYNLKKMNFLERFIIKKIAHVDKDISNLLEDNIDKFALVMNNA